MLSYALGPPLAAPDPDRLDANELEDRSTQAVFGDYISIYDIQRAVDA